jgi:hypothetical protein
MGGSILETFESPEVARFVEIRCESQGDINVVNQRDCDNCSGYRAEERPGDLASTPPTKMILMTGPRIVAATAMAGILIFAFGARA